MKGPLVRNAVVWLVLTVAVGGLSACNKNPINVADSNVKLLFSDPSSMVVTTDDSSKVEIHARNANNDILYQAVDGQVGDCASTTSAALTVTPDPTRVTAEFPERFIVSAASEIGTNCIIGTSGGLSDTVSVVTVPDSVGVVSAPDSIRAGESDSMVVKLLTATGADATPFSRSDMAYYSSDTAVANFTDSIGDYRTRVSGNDSLVATWSGTDATQTKGVVTRQAVILLKVYPNVPTAAAFLTGDFGAIAPGDTVTQEVLVTDAQGNQNAVVTEVDSVSVATSTGGSSVVTATAKIDTVVNTTTNDTTAVPIVQLIGNAVGRDTISGTVYTVNGPLSYGPAQVLVLNPQVTSITPATGAPGSAVVIAGTNLGLAGEDTTVIVNDFFAAALDNTTSTSTALNATMPIFGNGFAAPVTVAVGGVPSPDTVTFTETGGTFDITTTEPANDAPDPATDPVIAFPFNGQGAMDGSGNVDDFFLVHVVKKVTINATLDWSDASQDLDMAVVDAGFTAYICADGATSAKPEVTSCTLDPGDYLFWIDYYSAGGPVTYTVTTQSVE